MNESIFEISINNWGLEQYFTFAISYLIPIIACVAIIIGGAWALYKYFNEKSRIFYEHILENVYSPLFNELIKMEFSRYFTNKCVKNKSEKMAVKDVPFITWKKDSTDFKMEIGKNTIECKTVDIFDFDNKLKVIQEDETKLKYAPRDLVALIQSYFFLDELKGAPKYESEKIKIQKYIRRNVILGYIKYRRKLGLNDVSLIKFCYSWLGILFFR